MKRVSPDCETFMQEAIRLSLEMMRAGKGGPFGAVVVRDGEIIGRGWNQVTSANDPTAHAEIVAIREACRKTGAFLLEGAELYASCEPCPMCLSAAYWARISRVYYAASRRDAAEAGFLDEIIYEELAAEASQRRIPCIGLGREQALAAFREWKQKPDRIPY
jgi:tRNA(Arg) A34 adenosine deaminase TadA